jgi:hypothetical protein
MGGSPAIVRMMDFYAEVDFETTMRLVVYTTEQDPYGNLEVFPEDCIPVGQVQLPVTSS